jgi:hypothetical protein
MGIQKGIPILVTSLKKNDVTFAADGSGMPGCLQVSSYPLIISLYAGRSLEENQEADHGETMDFFFSGNLSINQKNLEEP